MRRWLTLALLCLPLALGGQTLVPVTAVWDMPADDSSVSAEIERDGTTYSCGPITSPTLTERRCSLSVPSGTASYRVRMANALGWGAWSPAISATVPVGSQTAPGPFVLQWHHVPTLTETEMAADYDVSDGFALADWTSAGGTQNFTVDGGSGANRVMYVFWAGRDDRHTGWAIAFDGVSLTQVGNRVAYAGTGGGRLFRLVNPASGAHTLAFTVNAGSGSAWGNAVVIVLHGVDQTTPNDAPVEEAESGSDASTVQDITVSSATGDRVVMVAAFHNDTFQTTGSVVSSSYTLRQQTLNGGSGARLLVGDVSGDASRTLSTSYNNAAGAWTAARVAFNVNAATGGGGVYELDAQPGSFTVTGSQAGLAHVAAIDGQPGAYTLTGADAGLSWQPALDAQPGSYVVTGADAGTVHDAVLDGQPGAYVLTGADAGVAYEAALDAQPASYTVTGADAGLAHGAVLDAQPGAYVITGADATLEDTTGGGIAYELDAQPGAYVVTGSDAGLAYGATLDAQPAAYVVTGASAGMTHGATLNAQAAAYAVTGADATLSYGAVLDAQPGGYAVTGLAAGTVHGAVLDAQPGAYLITGAAAGLESSQDLAATAHTTVRVRAVPSVIRVRPAPSTLSVD